MSLGGLSTSDINNLLRGVKIFQGAYAADLVPLSSKVESQAFIINTARANAPGTHWVGLLVSSGKCHFFDSFGRENLNLDILNACKKVGIKRYHFSTKQIQPVYSEKCGFYCIAFVLSFTRGMSYRRFLKLFSDDLGNNDKICMRFINEFY